MLHFIHNFKRNDSGATAIEYGLIAALIAVVMIAGLQLVGPQLLAIFTGIATDLGAATAG